MSAPFDAGRTAGRTGHVALIAEVAGDGNGNPTASRMSMRCNRCRREISYWYGEEGVDVPLPEVLARVDGHVCEVTG